MKTIKENALYEVKKNYTHESRRRESKAVEIINSFAFIIGEMKIELEKFT